MKKFLDDFVLVKDDEIMDATRITFNNTHILPESASASTLAASLKLKKELKGRRVALVITGGNTSKEEIKKILST
jgi:threonine dehydratase